MEGVVSVSVCFAVFSYWHVTMMNPGVGSRGPTTHTEEKNRGVTTRKTLICFSLSHPVSFDRSRSTPLRREREKKKEGERGEREKPVFPSLSLSPSTQPPPLCSRFLLFLFMVTVMVSVLCACVCVCVILSVSRFIYLCLSSYGVGAKLVSYLFHFLPSPPPLCCY